jgi:putative flippase GtrA
MRSALQEETEMWKSIPAIARSRLARFLTVGGVSYVVNQALLFILYDHGFPPLLRASAASVGPFDSSLLLASLVALEISILVRFALNDCWTFRDRRGKSLAARFYQHNVSSFGSPVIALAAVNILTPLLGMSYLIANSIGILLGLAWNWFWSVRVIWAETTEWVSPRTLRVKRAAPRRSPRREESSNPASL